MLFENQKNKLDKIQSFEIIKDMLPKLEELKEWNVENINNELAKYAEAHEYKIGKVMWPLRIAVTGNVVTPGGSAEMMYLLGKDESLKRIKHCIERLK